MELLSKGIKLEVSEELTASPAKWRNLYGLSEVPDMGGEKEKIEVTNLADSNKRYINGISDFGDLEFRFFYNKEETPDDDESEQVMESYSVMRAYELANTELSFRLVYPDNTAHQWTGFAAARRNSAAVNAALEFTLSVTVSSEMKDVTVSPSV